MLSLFAYRIVRLAQMNGQALLAATGDSMRDLLSNGVFFLTYETSLHTFGISSMLWAVYIDLLCRRS
jgi:hypothetical protein